MAGGCYRLRRPSRCSSSRPTSAAICSTTQRRLPRRPTAPRRRPSRPGDRVDRRRQARRPASRSRTPRKRLLDHRRSRRGSRCGSPPAAPATPRPTSTSRAPVRGRHAVPGGARLRRRAHPRDGLRVPRRRGALRPALAPVRRAVALVDCPDHTSPAATARCSRRSSPAQPTPRPGRLADVQGLAGARLADPRGHLLQVDGARLARRPADVRQPARREQQALQLYPLKRNSCDDMDSIRLQAKDMYQFQDYIDAQYGGPGKGWYRIVTDPFAGPRRSSTQGKLAVVMGIETSVPFGCTIKLDVPACDASDDRRAARRGAPARACGRWSWSTSSTTRCPASPATRARSASSVNGANFLETGSFWDMQHCEPARRRGPRQQPARRCPRSAPSSRTRCSARSASSSGARQLPVLPLYPPPDHCNSRGLTTSASTRSSGLAEAQDDLRPRPHEREGPQGRARPARGAGLPRRHLQPLLVDPGRLPADLQLGGFVAPYAGDSTGFVEKWRKHLGWADPRYYFGFGYGADMNGLGAQGDPRGADVRNPVTYPFTGLGGVTVEQAAQRRAGLRHQRRRRRALRPLPRLDRGPAQGRGARTAPTIVDDMARGAEAYLQMWERAVGITGRLLPQPGPAQAGRRRSSDLVRPGMSRSTVMRAVGQPFRRLGTTFDYCATTPPSDPKVAGGRSGCGRPRPRRDRGRRRPVGFFSRGRAGSHAAPATAP